MRCVMICSLCILLIALWFGLLGSTIRAQPDEAEAVRITILYDNNRADERLEVDWGFAALIKYGDQTILFDTGTTGEILWPIWSR